MDEHRKGRGPEGVHSFRARARRLAAIGASVSALLALVARCGGTTGRENIPAGASSTSSSSASSGPMLPPPPSAASVDAGYDATIQYADPSRLPEGGLPEAAADATDGGEAGPLWARWPACACDTLNSAGVEQASDAAGCSPSEVVWSARPICDEAYRGLGNDPSATGVNPFPPCCSLLEAGVAQTGPGQGLPLFQLCAEWYICAVQTSCWTNNLADCYCGFQASAQACQLHPTGACGDKIARAYQFAGTDPVANAVYLNKHIADVTLTGGINGTPWYAGGAVGAVLNIYRTSGKSATDGGPPVLCNPGPDASLLIPGPLAVDLTPATKTETMIHQYSPSCFACLKANGCLDDNRGDVFHECEDLAGQMVPADADAGAGQSLEQRCYDALQCLLEHPACVTEAVSTGTTNLVGLSAASIQCSDDGGPVCTAQQLHPELGPGVANLIFDCAYAVNCVDACTPGSGSNGEAGAAGDAGP